jgi:hypothetical protein
MAGLEKAVTIDARSQFHLAALLGIHLCVMAGHLISKGTAHQCVLHISFVAW